MKLTKKTVDLICELESIIGNQCYNPNSVNGWTLEEGCSFRYPVTYKDKNNEEYKCRYTLKGIDKGCIDTICYKFGSNNLYIGCAIVKILERLEKKYGLNFDELVKTKK